ncbi:hypothetical protein [Castellaniella sp.]|jgi:hypothetical protein|uniref:hypothetical protein n=1 Tax=Castellaniella sp. TaxID=1955812 RepID=UPI002AFF8F57|nr:hypothetical protein [Castellaniella sp.]
MRSLSQTLIGILREEIDDHRRIHRLSRETVTRSIVEAHEALGADASTGIRFEPKTLDTFERTKVNADRVFRWLDDSTKDNNLLPANFLVSLLAGLPDEVRRRILDRILLPLGFAARALGGAAPGAPISPAEVADLVREQGEASAAFTGLLDGYDRPELLNTRQQMAEAVEVAQRALARIDAKIAEGQEA